MGGTLWRSPACHQAARSQQALKRRPTQALPCLPTTAGTNVWEEVVPEENRPLPPARCRINKALRKVRDVHTHKQAPPALEGHEVAGGSSALPHS